MDVRGSEKSMTKLEALKLGPQSSSMTDKMNDSHKLLSLLGQLEEGFLREASYELQPILHG